MTRRLVFIDTWGWVAATARHDAGHSRARELGLRLQRAGCRWLTSDYVLVEAVTRLRYDVDLGTALSLLDTVTQLVDASILEVVRIDSVLWEKAVSILRRYADQRFSFTDCTSFAIMQARGVAEALTADTHFAIAGFVPLGAG